MRKYLSVFALSALVLASAASARADARVYVRIGPPRAVVETRIVAPSPRHVWIAGYHRWDGAAYLWVPGRWELPTGRYHRWSAGHWSHHRNGWYWVAGHWK